MLQKAGVELQDEFDQVVQDQGALGNCVIQTHGHNLACVLFHVIVPQWDRGKGTAIKVLVHFASLFAVIVLECNVHESTRRIADDPCL